MRITNFFMDDLEIEDSCPKCYVISSIVFGKMHVSDLPEEVLFHCRKCHNEWYRRVDQYWYMLDLKT